MLFDCSLPACNHASSAACSPYHDSIMLICIFYHESPFKWEKCITFLESLSFYVLLSILPVPAFPTRSPPEGYKLWKAPNSQQLSKHWETFCKQTPISMSWTNQPKQQWYSFQGYSLLAMGRFSQASSVVPTMTVKCKFAFPLVWPSNERS